MSRPTFQPDSKITVLAPTRVFVPREFRFVTLECGDEVTVYTRDKETDILCVLTEGGTELLVHRRFLDLSPLEALARAADEGD